MNFEINLLAFNRRAAVPMICLLNCEAAIKGLNCTGEVIMTMPGSTNFVKANSASKKIRLTPAMTASSYVRPLLTWFACGATMKIQGLSVGTWWTPLVRISRKKIVLMTLKEFFTNSYARALLKSWPVWLVLGSFVVDISSLNKG